MLKEKLNSMYKEANVAYKVMLSEKVEPTVKEEAPNVAKILCENMVEKMTAEITANNGKPPRDLKLCVEMHDSLGELTVLIETTVEERAAIFPVTAGSCFENGKMCQEYNSKLDPKFKQYLMDEVKGILAKEGVYSKTENDLIMFYWSYENRS